MHKSRLGGLIIDCRTDDLDAAADSGAPHLASQQKRSEDPADAAYIALQSGRGDLYVEVQQVSHDSRVHLDIEADDVEAEVSRLEALGAKRIGDVRTWCVMEAPTGQRFCVVKIQPESNDKGSTPGIRGRRLLKDRSLNGGTGHYSTAPREIG